MSAKYEVLVLSEDWTRKLEQQGETKMGGVQSARAKLSSGVIYLCVVDQWKYIFYVEGEDNVPFSLTEIEDIIVTHEQIDNDLYIARINCMRGRSINFRPMHSIKVNLDD
ncbi:MAG: hypothetical protein ABFD69_08090 [Candidatus Sumerlaeia bacterium]